MVFFFGIGFRIVFMFVWVGFFGIIELGYFLKKRINGSNDFVRVYI